LQRSSSFNAKFNLTWKVNDDIDSIIIPVQSESVDDLVRSYLAPKVTLRSGTQPASATLIHGAARPADLANIALGLRLVVRREGKIAATGWCWHAGDSSRTNGQSSMRPVLIVTNQFDKGIADAFDALSEANRPGPEWTISIESDQRLALRDFEATRCWSGKLTWSLAEVIKP
jgi:hypothetical protein